MKKEAELFKILADPTRLRLAVLLAVRGETCVCELARALDAPEFRISRHLGVMRAAGMVKARRAGTWMHYQLRKPKGRLEACLQDCFKECLADHRTIKADLQRLAKSGCRPEGSKG